MLNEIEQKIENRGHELPIENRMKKSIFHSFKVSSLSTEQVNENNKKTWGQSIYNRAKVVGLEKAYMYVFGLQSHFIHGNWQDLVFHHVEYDNDGFLPKPDWCYSKPQALFAVALQSAGVNMFYLDDILPECEDKDQINELLNDVISRTRIANDLHEQFLQKG